MRIDMKEFTGECTCGKEHRLKVKDMILEQGHCRGYRSFYKKILIPVPQFRNGL